MAENRKVVRVFLASPGDLQEEREAAKVTVDQHHHRPHHVVHGEEPALGGDNSEAPVQFERQGYFCRDPDSRPGRLVFNRTIGLRDSWTKAQAGSR